MRAAAAALTICGNYGGSRWTVDREVNVRIAAKTKNGNDGDTSEPPWISIKQLFQC